MAVLYQFLEGFSGYGGVNSALDHVVKQWRVYALPSSTRAKIKAGPFAGSLAVEMWSAEGALGINLPSSGSWCKYGFWWMRDSLSVSVFPAYLYEGGTAHVTLEATTTGAVVLRRGGGSGTVVGTSAGTPLSEINRWYWIEARIRISDSISAGDAVVYVDGVEVLSLAGGTDTRNGLTGVCNRFALYTSSATTVTGTFASVYFELVEGQSDALYGPCRVDTVYPTSDGHHQDGTPSVGADRWAVVDDGTLDGGDYTDLADVGDRDSFGVGTIPALVDATVYGVQVQVMAQSSDAGARSMAPMLRVGSTDYDGAASDLSPSLLGYTAAWPTNPAGGAWTQSAAQSAQPGAVVTE
jgi:hypothetical protein